jgi:hypothetical protein
MHSFGHVVSSGQKKNDDFVESTKNARSTQT